jgi:uncharacterized protein YcbK (DUF882 family)
VKDIQLSDNFKLSEFLANSHGFHVVPTKEEVQNLKRICDYILQPIRDEFNVPITISSGLRSIGLNSVVGGRNNSRHLRGLAVDIQVKDPFKLVEIFYYIIRFCDYHSVIYYNTNFLQNRFIHISIEKFGVRSKNNIIIREGGVFYPLDAWLKPAFSVI